MWFFSSFFSFFFFVFHCRYFIPFCFFFLFLPSCPRVVLLLFLHCLFCSRFLWLLFCDFFTSNLFFFFFLSFNTIISVHTSSHRHSYFLILSFFLFLIVQDEPFTDHLPEALFNIARYLLHLLLKETPLGVSRVYLLKLPFLLVHLRRKEIEYYCLQQKHVPKHANARVHLRGPSYPQTYSHASGRTHTQTHTRPQLW